VTPPRNAIGSRAARRGRARPRARIAISLGDPSGIGAEVTAAALAALGAEIAPLVFGDPRLDALDLAGQILSGGKGSRLNRRLVREERIAQDVALFTLPFIGGASVCAGWVTVRPGIDVARVETAFHEELHRLTTDLVSEDELARAKALTEADELGSLQRVEERADRLSMYATLFDRPGMVNEMLPRYLAVTPEQIRDAARAVFRVDNRLVLTYLPEGPSADDVTLVPRADGQADDEEAAA